MDTLDKWLKDEIKKMVSEKTPKIIITNPIKPKIYNGDKSCINCIYHYVSTEMLSISAVEEGYYYDACTKYKPYEHIILNVDEAEGCEYYKEE